MKLIGLTGGVGMGKSTAASFLLSQGVRLIDTDDLARQLVQPGQPALAEIAGNFGSSVLTAAGELDRVALAQIVFADPVARQKLEAILHPCIRVGWQAQVESWRQENCTVGVVVIPLLFETKAEAAFDKIICVACLPASQVERLGGRGWNPEQIRQRIASQLPIEQKIARSQLVIWSEGTIEAHRQQVGRILSGL